MSTATMERPAQAHFSEVERAASVIAREWPEEKTCYGSYRLPDGSMCSLGVLADAKGYDWDAWFSPRLSLDVLAPGLYVQQTWGFTYGEIDAIREAHDLYGKETAVLLIESFEVKHAAR